MIFFILACFVVLFVFAWESSNIFTIGYKQVHSTDFLLKELESSRLNNFDRSILASDKGYFSTLSDPLTMYYSDSRIKSRIYPWNPLYKAVKNKMKELQNV